MKTSIPTTILAAALLAGAAATADAAPLTRAEVTRIKNDVKILPGAQSPRPARVGDAVSGETAVRTGTESRAELKFTDETLARLGSNTIFSFEEGTRDLELESGVILLQVPKNAGGAKVRTAAVTAAITGTTILLEYSPTGDGTTGHIKVIVLEGTLRLSMSNRLGESVLLEAGQMIILAPGDNSLPEPVYIDVARLVQTSPLITDDFENLSSDDLIQRVIQDQLEGLGEDDLLTTNLIIIGEGTNLFLLNEELQAAFDAFRLLGSQGQTPGNDNGGGSGGGFVGGGAGTPPGSTPGSTDPGTTTVDLTLSKYGPAPVFAGNFIIDGSTIVITDPIISRGDITHTGTIYRDEAMDGPLNEFLFGPVNSFDIFVQSLGGEGPGGGFGVFKFEEIELVEGPLIFVDNGPTKLALVATGNIYTPNWEDDSYGEEEETYYSGSSTTVMNSTLFEYTLVTGLASGEGELPNPSYLPEQETAMEPEYLFNLDILDTLMLGTVDGSVYLGGELEFVGTNESIFIHARGGSEESGFVSYMSNTTLPEGFVSLAGQQGVEVGGTSSVGTVNVTSGDLFGYYGNYETSRFTSFSQEETFFNGALMSPFVDMTAQGDFWIDFSQIDSDDIRILGRQVDFYYTDIQSGDGSLAPKVDIIASSDTGNGIDLSYSTISSNGPVDLLSAGPLELNNSSVVEGSYVKLIANTVEVDGSEVTAGNDVSPGMLEIQSLATSGVGIHIRNSSQIKALTNLAGSGGSIGIRTQGAEIRIEDSTVLAEAGEGAATLEVVSNGGPILIDGSMLTAQGGSILVDTKDAATTANVALNNSTFTADQIRVRAYGPQGQLNIMGGSFNAGQAMQLYADGSNGAVQFMSDTVLNTPPGFASAALAGKSVTVLDGVNVTVNGSTLWIYGDNLSYSSENGGNDNTTGQFSGDGAPWSGTTGPFADRPAFGSAPPYGFPE